LTNVSVRVRVFFDIGIGEKYAGRIIFGLYSDNVPMTCENFVQLCRGYTTGGKTIGYKNTEFHRVLPGKMLYGGDTLTGTGSSPGMSIYGPAFPDENYSVDFVQDGDLAMYSNGPNTNASQFLITLKPLQRLHGQFVCFGTVVKGMKVVRAINDQATRMGALVSPVRIINCGLYDETNPPIIPAEFSKDENLTEAEWKLLKRNRYTT
jgi:peptidylprolyl isomerase